MEHREANKQSQQQKEKRIHKNEINVRSLWDNFKCTNIHITGVPEGEEKEQDTGNLFEKTVKENVLNLVKVIDIQVQEAQKTNWTQRVPHQDTSYLKCQRLKIERQS